MLLAWLRLRWHTYGDGDSNVYGVKEAYETSLEYSSFLGYTTHMEIGNQTGTDIRTKNDTLLE